MDKHRHRATVSVSHIVLRTNIVLKVISYGGSVDAHARCVALVAIGFIRTSTETGEIFRIPPHAENKSEPWQGDLVFDMGAESVSTVMPSTL